MQTLSRDDMDIRPAPAACSCLPLSRLPQSLLPLVGQNIETDIHVAWLQGVKGERSLMDQNPADRVAHANKDNSWFSNINTKRYKTQTT